ncbi:MAG: alpha-amylase family glycosyl hydrolase, partial [Planctomycetia bacterium]|nr:alpha-amylase family glycosyl hydrolase [Planctomycetia bacterium]
MKLLFSEILRGCVLFSILFWTTTGRAAEEVPLNQRPARKSPEWIQKAVLYQINTRAFTPEGTLQAAKEKLPLLKEAGVTVIYFCPLFTMDDDMDEQFWSPRQVKSQLGNPKNPYRMNDYDKIDPEYGTEADAKELIRAAHELGLRVMFDLVYLHCGPKATLVKTHPEYFRRNPDGSIHLTQWKFPEFDFTKP